MRSSKSLAQANFRERMTVVIVPSPMFAALAPSPVLASLTRPLPKGEAKVVLRKKKFPRKTNFRERVAVVGPTRLREQLFRQRTRVRN